MPLPKILLHYFWWIRVGDRITEAGYTVVILQLLTSLNFFVGPIIYTIRIKSCSEIVRSDEYSSRPLNFWLSSRTNWSWDTDVTLIVKSSTNFIELLTIFGIKYSLKL